MNTTITFEKENFIHFIRSLGHNKETLTVGDTTYGIGLLCGKTNLLPCPEDCEQLDGYYVTLETREKQKPLSFAYHCYICNKNFILEYPVDYVPSDAERLFIVEASKTEQKRLESQLHKRLEKNIFYNRVNWNNPDPFAKFITPEPDIEPKCLYDEELWQLPYHAKQISSMLKIQKFQEKDEKYFSPGTIVHVIVNNRYLMLGILLDDELFIYYGRDDLKDPESNENYHKMVEYVQKLPKPLLLFDYDYKIFGAGLQEDEYILFDHLTGIDSIVSYGLSQWPEELKEELGPQHFIANNPLKEAKTMDEKFNATMQGFELVLIAKRRIIEEVLMYIQTNFKSENKESLD